ncbi:MAG: DUF1080 domain-containing protein [Cyclobacteriaceae bacterium]|nr:DUF1080 domain-containing protein [Cyclobacteriaceae bacterium]
MKRKAHLYFGLLMAMVFLFGCQAPRETYPLSSHPDSESWPSLFARDLSNAVYPEGVWTFADGEYTASEDQNLWTERDYDNFVLDLEFKTAEGTNSGVVVYCSDPDNWIPNSIEIQIADDYHETWATSPTTWQCGAFFGHKPAVKSVVNRPGEWNRYTVTCIDQKIYILLNGVQVNEIDLSAYTDATMNPDGSEVPAWLSNPWSELPTKGKIGFQGKHAGAPVYFRNIRVKELD